MTEDITQRARDWIASSKPLQKPWRAEQAVTGELIVGLVAEIDRLTGGREGACAGAGKKPTQVTRWFGKEPSRALCNVCNNEFSVNVNGKLRFHRGGLA